MWERWLVIVNFDYPGIYHRYRFSTLVSWTTNSDLEDQIDYSILATIGKDNLLDLHSRDGGELAGNRCIPFVTGLVAKNVLVGTLGILYGERRDASVLRNHGERKLGQQ